MHMDPGNDETAHRKVAGVEAPVLHHQAGASPLSPKAASGEVAYGLAAGLAEASAAIELFELWAGIASLSAEFKKAGIPLSAFLESNPLLFQALRVREPQAQYASKSELEEWREWNVTEGARVVVVGGPSCTSLSVAGKREAANDPTSRYLFDHLSIAAWRTGIPQTT